MSAADHDPTKGRCARSVSFRAASGNGTFHVMGTGHAAGSAEIVLIAYSMSPMTAMYVRGSKFTLAPAPARYGQFR